MTRDCHVSPFIKDTAPNGATLPAYPHVVVRLMATVYQREAIALRQGTAGAQIKPGGSFLQHPEIDPETPGVPAAARQVLLDGVAEAVRRTRHRMCVVWGPGASTYVELDGSTEESSEPPSGGISLPAPIAFDQRVRMTTEDGRELGIARPDPTD